MSQFLKAKIIDPVTGLPSIITFADQTYIDQQIQLGFANKVTSITGTVNQIIVTGTTTPVLSLSNTLVLPGTLTTTGDLTVNSTGYLKMAVGTTLQRPTLPAVGMTRFNTTLGLFEIYNGTSWIGLSGGSGTVSSVGITASNGLSVSGSPVTNSGTISLTLGTELQGLNNLSLAGLVSRTAVGTYNSRSIVAGIGINITNGDGVSGNPTVSLGTIPLTSLSGYVVGGINFLKQDGTWSSIPTGTVTSVGITGSTGLSVSGSPITTNGTINLTLSSELQALSTFAAAGLIAKTGSNAYVGRTLTASTGISISNGNGISGNPTVSISNTAVTSGTYPYPSSLTVNAQGQLTSITAGNPPITSLTLTGAITGSGSSSIATTLSNYQTMIGSTLSFNWSNNGSFAEYSNYHTLQDSNPPSHFVHLVQSGSGSTYRRWLTVYKPGFGSQPTGTYEINFYHAVNGFQYPFKIDTYGSTLRTYFGTIVDMQNNEIINAAFPTTSSSLITKGYADSLITTQLQNLNNLNTLGFVVLSSTGSSSSSFVNRTLVAGTGISITNSNGVSGNPTISVSNIPISSLSGYPSNSNLFLNGLGSWTTPTATVILPLNFYTSSLAESGITIYNSNNSSYASGFRAYNQNTGYGVEFGLNNSTSEAYVFASSTLSLKFGTNGITRMKINSNGSIDCYSNDITTTGTINATTGGLKANNLSAYNSSAIICDPLAVTGGYAPYNGSYGYLNSSGNTGTASGSNTYSINATYRVKASEFNAVSSIKKKHVLAQGIEIEKEVVEIIKKTEFFKYEYKDQIAEKGIRYGVIAEELAKTLPDYIDYENMEYIPNIMQVGRLQKIKNTKYQYILNSENKIEISAKIKRLKLINNKNKVLEVEISDILDIRTLKINAKEEISEKVFIYGTYEQCPSVASKVTELALIAVKNLLTRIENLEEKLL